MSTNDDQQSALALTGSARSCLGAPPDAEDWQRVCELVDAPDAFAAEDASVDTCGLAYYDSHAIAGVGAIVSLDIEALFEDDAVADIYESYSDDELALFEEWLQVIGREEGVIEFLGCACDGEQRAHVAWANPERMRWSGFRSHDWIDCNIPEQHRDRLRRRWGAAERVEAHRRQASCVDDFLATGGRQLLTRTRETAACLR